MERRNDMVYQCSSVDETQPTNPDSDGSSDSTNRCCQVLSTTSRRDDNGNGCGSSCTDSMQRQVKIDELRKNEDDIIDLDNQECLGYECDVINRLFLQLIQWEAAFKSSWEDHKESVSLVLCVLLVITYFAYFGYALWFQFGDKDSVRLLWMTCLVVCVFVWRLVRHCVGVNNGVIRSPSRWPAWKLFLERDVTLDWTSPRRACREPQLTSAL